MIPILSSFLLLFTLGYLALMLYLKKGWGAIPNLLKPSGSFHTRVSVVVAARNEEANIRNTIECLLAQDYPKNLLEIIIVDDHSSDNTASIIASYKEQGVQLLSLKEKEAFNSYKKIALSKAIDLSTGELIVATDADCEMGTDWLKSFVYLYEKEDPYFISAPVVYFKEKNLFERLQSLEFLYLIGLGAATIGNGRASTCNGANLAYKREVFYELGGFSGIDNLASGDDELFLHKVAAAYPEKIRFCKAQEALVYTEAKPTLSSFLSQRKRWASKSTHYTNISIVSLGVSFWLFNLFLALGLFFALFGFLSWKLVFLCFALKVFMELLFIAPLAEFARKSKFLLFLPILSVLHVFYLIYIGISGNSGKYQWKGRKVR